ncbi:hypothetical protein [Mariluticola halotolerans]|uniref:hypothetical protein n=1 Tax=Mariluticola halotolerans TaxID=2909283 RepID=UPI0026E2B88B|nr:hypothetical protein [Mariluticola halotolerans]UJQ95427.1 hypothetical protein L1P08_05425 [Mariluticola halotolerans]
MSARIAPEPISIGITMGAEFSPRASRTTRPIEAIAASTPDPQQSRSGTRTLADGDKARSGERPPGKDPSIPPQTLFDAALIASEFKANTKVELPDPADIEASDTGATARADSSDVESRAAESRESAEARDTDSRAQESDSPAAA